MKDLIIKIITEESKRLINEGGIRDINNIAKRYKKAKIYFHQDLDGVTTALAMKHYLEQNGIKVVDAEIIQYGSKEFAIKKVEGEGDIMPVLVDFAHGKPMFVIHTDHHDSQAGVEQGTSTSFRPSRSNVETISQIVSPKDIFSTEDIKLISTVDSADYARYDITPEEVMNYLFKLDKDKSLQRNKMLMGLAVNKLLLAYKNKPGFLEKIVMEANPSLLSMLNVIRREISEKGYAGVENLEKNKERYVQSMKSHKNVRVEDGIIIQYGGGDATKPGAYDRYTPFRNNPDADFWVVAWSMGILQASCNPFKKDRALKGVNLGEIKDEALSRWESQLKSRMIPLSTIKWVSESGKEFGEKSVGFTFKDFIAIYGNDFDKSQIDEKELPKVREIMDRPFTSLTPEEMELLDKITVSAWDIINNNSGGHKCITNISGLNYLGRGKRPPVGKYKYNAEKDDAPYIQFTKMLQSEMVKILKEKMKEGGDERYEPEFEIEVNESRFGLKKKDLKHLKLNNLVENKSVISEQKLTLPIKIKDSYTAPKGDADALHSFERRRSDKFGGKMLSKIESKLQEIYKAGINPDVVDLTINVDSKNYKVNWEATLDESKDGIPYMGLSTRGSAGSDADKRAEGQLPKLKRDLESKGAEDITLLLDFKNPKGVYIRQYFYKYSIPKKYPKLETTDKNYIRTDKPSVVDLGTDNKEILGAGIGLAGLNLKDMFSGWRKRLSSLTGGTASSDTEEIQTPEDTSTETIISTGGGESNFMDITKKVIENFEGGYWNPFCPSHPKSSMGKSTETMFGLDRYNGNIESTPEGQEFFKIIDDEKRAMGAKSSGTGKGMTWTNMDNFCKKWKWNSRGGNKEQKLKNLASSIMKRSFDRNMSNFVKDLKTKNKIMNNKGLLLHMSYASWNGPGFFQKFAKKLEQGVKQGMTDKELIDLAVQSRSTTGLLNKSKVERGIRNPDTLKS